MPAASILPLTAQILERRGVRSAAEVSAFLACKLQDLSDPYRLTGMDAAVRRILAAVDAREPILLHGDYDVDGLCATAILALALRRLGCPALTHIPHRLKEGYGVRPQTVKLAREQNVRVFVTLDCGISAHEALEEARRAGIDTIVVDHHLIPERGLPPAFAVINPKQDGLSAPGHDLSATGLAFKVAQAILGPNSEEFLDLAALGTVADQMPLVGDNRIFVKRGLERVGQARHPGLAALLALGRIRGKRLTPRDISFHLAPRINAASRMGSAQAALDLLLCEDPAEAERHAQVLERENRNRQAIERRAYAQAVRKVEREVAFATDRVIVVWDEGWHPGVVGILAARLVQRFYRPAFVVGCHGGTWRGSARVIPGFNAVQALSRAQAHLEEFGGHEAAAGFTVRPVELQALRRSLIACAGEVLDSAQLERPLAFDAEAPLEVLTTEAFWKELASLEPFGAGNPRPIFLTRSLTVRQLVKRGSKSVSFTVTDGTAQVLCRSTAATGAVPDPGTLVDLIYSPHWSMERGMESVWLDVKRCSPRSGGA